MFLFVLGAVPLGATEGFAFFENKVQLILEASCLE